ncbi:MAPEG family protein [Agrobacterium sp. DSM 25558]|uniref:MAPEG family protein n=1 Tax=Agrobacterium sp. DSM 25558 TaxID=1907665 RepID=UPI000972642D|nr:MAPEG family protein [Agrobacterium sp. DSM 25558]SCX09653.1 MAPEG family protein [Agrobacterium sp. DSM 25558]
MQPTFLAASPFLPLIGVSVIIILVHIALQALTATKELGNDWNASPRDDGKKVQGKLAGRAERALSNFLETYPAFIALAFGVIMAGDPIGIALIGAWIWIVCRIVYIPLYLAGIPYVRSLVWVGSMVGLLLMLFVLLF